MYNTLEIFASRKRNHKRNFQQTNLESSRAVNIPFNHVAKVLHMLLVEL